LNKEDTTMAADNFTTLTGNLTRDPELRFIKNGQGVANFGLAVNRRWQTNGEWQEQTSFFNIVAWAELGENAAATLTKGMRVTVTGRLDQRSWDAPDGTKKSTVEVVADDVAISLRWATAEVTRTQRSGTNAGSSNGGSSNSRYTQRSDAPASDPLAGIDDAFAPVGGGGTDIIDEPF
jgi:single-strand DNA-binding protein